MLNQRLLTAAILLPLVVGGVFMLPPRAFALVTAVVILLGAWEWAALMGSRAGGLRLGYVIVTGICLLGAEILRQNLAVHPRWIILFAALWLPCCLWLTMANRSVVRVSERYPAWLLAATGILVLVPSWLSLSVLHRIPGTGPWHVFFLLVLIWSADSGAYLAGRRWGKHKLAARISPGKTWEGVLGGLVASAIPALVAAAYRDDSPAIILMYLLVCLMTVMFSIAGDLLESLVKRQAHVKDSGTLLPGHGGVLDRIDSLTAAAPVYVAGLIITGQLS